MGDIEISNKASYKCMDVTYTDRSDTTHLSITVI